MPSKKSDYEVLETIGAGTFGIVKRIRRISDGKILVWKEIDYGRMSEKEKQMLVSEVNILREFNHPRIVRFKDRIIDRDNTTIYIVMEYCDGGDLASLIKRRRYERKYLDESFIWKIFAQVVQAVQECHRRKEGIVLHRDLKPANIFLDAKRNAKVGDFGLARVLGNATSFARTFVGTPYYMSPEQISERGYNEKSDIWSLGCLLYELAALVPPFDARNQAELCKKILVGKFKKLPSAYSRELNTIITSMLQNDPSRRPTIEYIMEYPPVRDYMERSACSAAAKRPSSKRAAAATAATTATTTTSSTPSSDEKALDSREKSLAERERQLRIREREVTARELAVERREKELRDLERRARLELEPYRGYSANVPSKAAVAGPYRDLTNFRT